MKKRICVFLVAFVLAVSIVAPIVSADVCTVAGCGVQVYTVHEGDSAVLTATHKYGGGFLVPQKTCYYDYFYRYYSQTCLYGHVLGSYSTRWESNHDCK